MDNKTERIAALEQLIQKYQGSYYGGEAEISDGEFDLLWDELKSLAPQSAVLKKIGAGDTDGFPKVRHLIPMGSQEKASNPQEFLAWVKKMETAEQNSVTLTDKTNKLTKLFIVQYKMDGASLELQYEKGKLQKAVTRGDGITGDDITPNARRIAGIAQELDTGFSGGIRGEVVMTHDTLQEKYSGKANCRNAANGIMRRKDGQGCEDLKLIVYDASVPSDDSFFQNETDKIEWLSGRGFETTVTKIFSTAQDIIAYRQEIAALRDRLPFDIDGLVVKDMQTDMADLRRARPEKQIAFKFDLETAFSVLRRIEWSESGATYTPIGIVDPVRIAGTTVKRANLNNPDMIRAMGLKIGSQVSVVERGGIIPKIEGLAPTEPPPGPARGPPCGSPCGPPYGPPTQTEEITFPEICGACQARLVDAGTRLYCPNEQCPKRLLHRLEKWVSVLDIRELGEKLLHQLFEKKRVRHIHDLYTLQADELAEYERMGDLSASKVIRHIQAKRELPLATFVAGFDLEGIAETTMEKIALAGFDTMGKLTRAKKADLAGVYTIGEITAAVLVDGLAECKAEMDAVLQTGVITIAAPPASESQPLRGLSFCFTGELRSCKRREAEEKIKALGAQSRPSVVKGLSYLVTNDTESGSTKNKKAREWGIAIINEEEFIRLLSNKREPVQGELFS
jgi:DNA ligase (NAD+)